MNSLQKGMALGALQCGLVLSLTGKLFYDRATCPRVWVKTAPYDPSLPIRGRYLSLLLAPEPGTPYFDRTSQQRVLFFVPEQRTEAEPLRFVRNLPEVWAEVTIPNSGPPRPIRLGTKKDGQIQPLEVR
jgi:hypothetical protein